MMKEHEPVLVCRKTIDIHSFRNGWFDGLSSPVKHVKHVKRLKITITDYYQLIYLAMVAESGAN